MNASNEWQAFCPRELHRTTTLKRLNSISAEASLSNPIRFRAIPVIALGLAAALFSSCTGGDAKQQKAQAAAPRPVSVAVAKVQQQDMPVYLTGLGSVT